MKSCQEEYPDKTTIRNMVQKSDSEEKQTIAHDFEFCKTERRWSGARGIILQMENKWKVKGARIREKTSKGNHPDVPHKGLLAGWAN